MQNFTLILRFSSCLLIGVLLYALVFSLVAKRPQSAGMIDKYFQHKISYAEKIQGPKVMLLGASNVRYSHRCETISQQLDLPCVNAGINNEVALDVLITNFEPKLNPGDTVYLPLSYEPYMWSQKTLDQLLSSVYLLQYSASEITEYRWRKRLNVIFYYDIPFFFSSLAESILPRFGVQRMAGKSRPFGIETLNIQGDETGHTKAQSEPFESLTIPFEWMPPRPSEFNPSDSDSGMLLHEFLVRSHQRNIKVIGGLPTVLDTTPIPDEIVTTLAAFYESAGQEFAALENRSQYPRSCFYDTGYHLNETCQIAHSMKVSELLKPRLNAEAFGPGKP